MCMLLEQTFATVLLHLHPHTHLSIKTIKRCSRQQNTLTLKPENNFENRPVTLHTDT